MTRLLAVLAVAALLLLSPVLAPRGGVPAPYPDPFGGMALAVQPDEVLPDARLEARARSISAGLRCLVCQNQSIDDSDAGLARDLRVLVRERLKAGDSDAAVIDYVVARYGEFVLLRPRLTGETLILWGTPVLLLAGGALYALHRSRRARASLTAQEEAAVDAALRERGL